MDTEKLGVLILGGGKLGSLVAKQCLKYDHLNVNIVVRNPDKIKELVAEIEQKGGKVIKGDVNNTDELQGCTQGIHTIVSTIPTFSDTEVKSQTIIMEEGIRNGAKRFFASHFGTNDEHKTNDNPLVNAKHAFNKILTAQTQIKPVIISCGTIIDFFLQHHNQEWKYWGDIDSKIQTITYEDLAKYVAAVVADPEKSGHFIFTGEEIPLREIIETYNKVRGTNVQPHRVGSVEEMKALGDQMRKEGNIIGSFLQFFYWSYSRKGAFSSNSNSEFPDIKITPYEEFLRQNPEVIIP